MNSLTLKKSLKMRAKLLSITVSSPFIILHTLHIKQDKNNMCYAYLNLNIF